MKFFLPLLLIGYVASAGPATKPLVDQKFRVGTKEFRLVIEAAPSKSETRGAGFCGSGEEVTMTIFSKARRKVFTKLIESCLEHIELAGGQLGHETTESILKAVKTTPYGIEVSWLSHEKQKNVRGVFSIEADKVMYTEAPLKALQNPLNPTSYL